MKRVKNRRVQRKHLNFLRPECTSMCLFRFARCVNDSVHPGKLHAKGR